MSYSIEHLFDAPGGGCGLLEDDWTDDLVYRLTLEAMAAEPDDDGRLPDLDALRPGPGLALILAGVDRTRLNGYDLVAVLKARERMVSHFQAEVMADMVEVAYAAPGDADAPPARLEEAFSFAADEIRAALSLTRRAAESRMSLAFDLIERLPHLEEMLTTGVIDLARVRIIIDGTAHLDQETARHVVDRLADAAPHSTTGQLRARIRKLCVTADAEDAKKRYETAIEQRRLWIEQTIDGTT
ncbi:MAG TPA: DUF222 domain-containing protein, partial [Acidimicrobiia bacterium]|nr:DUF222 domain-containing protein [Acidimicrobiia bacterium]